MATETHQLSDAFHAYTGGELPTMQDLFREQQENQNPQPTADALSKSAPALRKDQALSFKRNVRTIRQSGKDVNASVQSDAFGSTSFSPSPALELRWCIGYTSQPAGNMLWTSDSRSIIYSCSTNVICMNPDSNQQRFFLGHTEKVVVMALGPNDSMLATCQEGKKPTIRLWDVATGECVAMLNAHGSDVHCIDFNRQGTCIVAVGKEDKGAAKNFINLVVIWDISQVTKGGKAVKIVEQQFEPSLIKILYTPFEEGHLVSCGADNIHLWRIKKVRDKYELRRIVLPLGPHGNQTFLDLAFEGSLGSVDIMARKVYACTASGLVYQINYTNRVVDQIYRLHDGSINALVVTDGFCVTGSSDRFLRVWPLDFSDYFLEAEHAAHVNALSVSGDCLRIAIGTNNGTVGVMDVATHGYRTVVRSHESIVLALAMDPHNREFTTTASDGTIRIWDLDSYDQLYEFLAPGECAKCVVYHPHSYVMACGFENGAVRVFDIGTTSQLHEYRQHQARVVSLAFSQDGAKLFSAGEDGLICVYDALRNYQPIKTVVSAHAGDKIDLSLAPSGKLLASIGIASGSIVILNADTMDKVLEIPAQGRSLKLVQFAPIQNEVYAITQDCRLHRYCLNTGELAYESSPLHLDVINAMSISDNGRFLLTGGNEGLLKLWLLGKNGPHEKRCQSFIGHPSTITAAMFSPDKRQVVSVGSGYGILVWDVHVDASEDISEYVDRLIDERTHAEQQRVEEQAEGAETPPPRLPIPATSQAVSEMIDAFRQRLRADDLESEEMFEGLDPAAAHALGREPSPLVRVRERAMGLDLSLTPTQASQTDLIDAPSRQADRNVAPLNAQPLNALATHQEALPLKHYVFRRVPARRAERKYVASEDEAGLRAVRMVGSNTQSHDALVWHAASGYFATAIASTIVVEDLLTREQTLLSGHEDEISTLSLNPDGTLLASASGFADETDPAARIFVWDTEKGTMFRRLDFHHRGVQAMAWSMDGKYLLSIGTCQDGKLAIWDVTNNKVIAATDVLYAIHDARFTANSNEFVTVGHMNITFWLWAPDGKLHMQEKSAPNEQPNVHYTCLDIAQDGKNLFVGSSFGAISQWEVSADRNVCTGTWQTSQGELSIIRCRGDRIITCGNTPHVRVWEFSANGGVADAGKWQVVRELNLDGPAHSLSIDADGLEGVAATRRGSIWHLGGGSAPAVRIGGGNASPVVHLAYSDSGHLIASCTVDGAVNVWAVRGMQHLRSFESSGAGCNCIAFAPSTGASSSRTISAGYADGVIRQLDLSSAIGANSEAILIHDSPIRVLQYAQASDYLLCGSADGTLSSVCLPRRHVRKVSAVVPSGAAVCSLCWNADASNTWLASSADGCLDVFSIDVYTVGTQLIFHLLVMRCRAYIHLPLQSPSQSSISLIRPVSRSSLCNRASRSN
jgi:WD repeat-containing protein 90